MRLLQRSELKAVLGGVFATCSTSCPGNCPAITCAAASNCEANADSGCVSYNGLDDHGLPDIVDTQACCYDN